MSKEKLEIPKAWKRLGGDEKCHFVQEIRDGNEHLIAYKWYSKSKRRWFYEVERVYLLNLFHWKK